MSSVLVTAFEPYDHWESNSSWLALVELTKDLPGGLRVTTRRYPVNFEEMSEQLASDLADDYDFALHLGQAPGSGRILLEAIGVNIGGLSRQPPEEYQPLVPDGPTAYRSCLPLADWSVCLRAAGIPAQVSYHAGAFLCNATLYMSHYFAQQQQLKLQSTFIHLPLDVSQATTEQHNVASLPAQISAAAIRLLLRQLPGAGQRDEQEA